MPEQVIPPTDILEACTKTDTSKVEAKRSIGMTTRSILLRTEQHHLLEMNPDPHLRMLERVAPPEGMRLRTTTIQVETVIGTDCKTLHNEPRTCSADI